MKLFRELKRRNVFRAALAYLVTSWVILQIVAILFPILQIDMVYQRYALIALIIGFPIWLVFAWIYEWTPDGFRQTPNVADENTDSKYENRRSTRYIIMGLSLALILLVADKIFMFTTPESVTPSGIRTIAVLPFSHQSAEETDEFFTSGVHEDLMTKLAGVKDFRIIAKSSVMPYKDYEGDLKEVGDKLKADYIMLGSVRRWNDQIRMTVQLIESSTNQAVWSNEYDGKLENVFDLQANIATTITTKLQANLSRQEAQDLEAAPTSVLAAYDDYLKARELLNKPRSTYEDILEAIKLLEKAVKADDKFVNAWSMLVLAQGEVYQQLSKAGGHEEELAAVKARAVEAMEKARSLAPENWYLRRQEGIFYMSIEQDNLAAVSSFQKAIEQNPSDVVSMAKLAQLYFVFGKMDESIALLEEAFKISPTSGFIAYSLTYAYELNGEYDKMVPFLERLFELNPDQQHYLVEARYYQFLSDGKISSFREFQNSVEDTDAENPWDERAIKNMDMVVAMFNGEFDQYHQDWQGKHAQHIENHGDWMCPLVANDHLNHARLLIGHHNSAEASEILEEVRAIKLKPINPNSVCIFNPDVYLPKLDYLSGMETNAREELEAIALPVLQNESFPLGAVERSVLLQSVDLIYPEKVYYYYEQIVKNTISMTSFESICADPWTYPNLIKDKRFIAEVRKDGRFVEFLNSFGFLDEA